MRAAGCDGGRSLRDTEEEEAGSRATPCRSLPSRWTPGSADCLALSEPAESGRRLRPIGTDARCRVLVLDATPRKTLIWPERPSQGTAAGQERLLARSDAVSSGPLLRSSPKNPAEVVQVLRSLARSEEPIGSALDQLEATAVAAVCEEGAKPDRGTSVLGKARSRRGWS